MPAESLGARTDATMAARFVEISADTHAAIERVVRRLSPTPTAARHVETYWSRVAPSRKLLVCALYETDAGLELRLGYDDDDVLRSQRIESSARAASDAADWKDIIDASRRFINPDATAPGSEPGA